MNTFKLLELTNKTRPLAPLPMVREQAPGELTFAIIQQRVNEVLTVSDEQLVESMRFVPSAYGENN